MNERPKRKREDWQEDYSPETGMTGICPKCNSNDVEYDGPAPGCCYWLCHHCGYKENE